MPLALFAAGKATSQEVKENGSRRTASYPYTDDYFSGTMFICQRVVLPSASSNSFFPEKLKPALSILPAFA